MKRVRLNVPVVVAVLAVVSGVPAGALRAAEIADFEDLWLEPESYWNGSDGSGAFHSGGFRFVNHYDSQWESWDGWSYSNMTDNTTPGWANQYSAYPGGGYGGSATYAVAYVSGFSDPPTLALPEQGTVAGTLVANTTYAVLAMQNGDAFSKRFGGPTGDDPDWFLLSIRGIDSSGNPTPDVVDFYLADYRFSDNALDYIVEDWTWVDLSGLGEVVGLQFELSSSDTGEWGINTPAYFAVDNLATIPEPSTLMMIACGALCLLFRIRRPAKKSS